MPPKSEEKVKLIIDSGPSMHGHHPLLLEYLAQSPVLIPMYNNILLQDSFSHLNPMVTQGQLQLAARKLSGGTTEQQEFRKVFQAYTVRVEQRNNIILPVRKKWSCRCNQREIDPFSCDVKHFLDFLSELFQYGLQHQTINFIHSAVSMMRDRGEGVPIRQYPLVTHLLRSPYSMQA